MDERRSLSTAAAAATTIATAAAAALFRKFSENSGRGGTPNPHGLLRVPATTAGGRSPQLVSRDEVVRENKRAVRRWELWQRQRWQGKDSDSDWD